MKLSMKILLGLVGGGGGTTPVTYLFRDLFTTARSAGAVDGTDAEPGPGIRNVTDVDDTRVSISSSGCNIKGNGAWQSGLYNVDQAITRGMGMAVFFRFTTHTPDANSVTFGLSDVKNQMYNIATAEYVPITAPHLFAFWGKGPLITNGQQYEVAIICRPKGLHYLIRGGTEYPEWSHVYTTFGDTTATLYFIFESFHNFFSVVKDVRFVQLLAPFATDYAFATNRVASAGVNEVITHEADGHIEHTWTAVTSEVLTILFRRTDDDNCYKLVCTQADGTIKLYKREAGADTELDSGKTQTWTNGTVYRIIIRFWGQHIVTEVNKTRKHDYTTASFNLTAITAKVDKAGTNFIAWPWTLSGTALSEVERVSGPF